MMNVPLTVREQIIGVLEKEKALANDQSVLFEHMTSNRHILFMWIVDESSDGIDFRVKLNWGLDDEFREEFGSVEAEDFDGKPDYGGLLPDYQDFSVSVDRKALESLNSGNEISYEHG